MYLLIKDMLEFNSVKFWSLIANANLHFLRALCRYFDSRFSLRLETCGKGN